MQQSQSTQLSINHKSFICSVFGLGVSVNLPLAPLDSLPATSSVDVDVALGMIPCWLDTTPSDRETAWYISPYHDNCGEPSLKIWEFASGKFLRLLFSDGVKAIIDREGSQIWATWPETQTLEDMGAYLLGPIFGVLLRLRGVTCLHASAVAVGDQAIVLLGPEGAGKSTTAAAFANLGYPVLSDDIVALVDQKSIFMVQPAYPRLRLWPKSVELLYGSQDALPLISPTWDKRYLDLTTNGHRFKQQPLPLACIYILNERTTIPSLPSFQAISARDGLMNLIANIYAANLPLKVMRAREFELLGRILDIVPLRKVTPCAQAPVSELCNAIIEDFTNTSARLRQ